MDKKQKLDRLYDKYRPNDNLIIARTTRRTIRYIEKTTINFPNRYSVLKNNIIGSCYNILESIYRANIMQEIKDKKEIIVNIYMLNFYLEEAYRKELINNRKLESFILYLIEIDKMTRGWFKYEEAK